MIEVEQKFFLQPGDKERLLKGATLVGTGVISDCYYDTDTAALVGHEMFLRERDGRFELKVPLHKLTRELPKAYHFNEVYDPGEIRHRLGLTERETMTEALRSAGYRQVARIKTTRTKYRNGQFTLDFDEADFGYRLVEIERTFEQETDRVAAANSIVAFATSRGLTIAHVRGKIHEYLRLKRPDLWAQVQKQWASWPEK